MSKHAVVDGAFGFVTVGAIYVGAIYDGAGFAPTTMDTYQLAIRRGANGTHHHGYVPTGASNCRGANGTIIDHRIAWASVPHVDRDALSISGAFYALPVAGMSP